MDIPLWLQAALLGMVEGLTEFLPVSSTGHLILVGDLLGFAGPEGAVFEVVIQLGAIVAVCVLYFRRLLGVALRLPTDPAARRFVAAVLLGFLPAAVLGLVLHDFIKTVLFSPWVVCVTLILGGLAILLIERIKPRPRWFEVERMPYGTTLAVGFCQALAMIPGVSRSGATIMGGLMLGVDRKTATEYSFFLAIPTMLGATVLDLYKARGDLTQDGLGLIVIGFVTAFVVAMLVIEALVAYVQRHGFVPFAWYRIAVGLVMGGLLLARS